jgi:hypothetical protein
MITETPKYEPPKQEQYPIVDPYSSEVDNFFGNSSENICPF